MYTHIDILIYVCEEWCGCFKMLIPFPVFSSTTLDVVIAFSCCCFRFLQSWLFSPAPENPCYNIEIVVINKKQVKGILNIEPSNTPVTSAYCFWNSV